MDDDAHLANPAGRLWLLLRDFQTHAAKSTQQKVISVHTVITAYLGLDPADRPGYYRSVAEILSMPVEIRAAVDALEETVPPKAVLLRPLDTLEGVLPTLAVGRTGSKTISDRIPSSVISELEVCSYVLNSHAPKATVAQNALDEIRSLANDIIDTLAADRNLSTEFREAIRKHTQRISQAVDAYKLYGSDAVLDALDGLTGVIVRNYAETQQKRANPVFDKVRKLAGAIITATALFAAPAEIATAVDFYLSITEGLHPIVEAPAEESSSDPV